MPVTIKKGVTEAAAAKQDETTKTAVKNEKPKGPPKKVKKTEEYFTEKYPHAIPGTLIYDESVRKQKMKIKCASCGNTERYAYTSDLFQVKLCLECAKKKRSSSRKKKEERPAEAPAA